MDLDFELTDVILFMDSWNFIVSSIHLKNNSQLSLNSLSLIKEEREWHAFIYALHSGISWHLPISILTRILLRIVIHCLQCSFVNNNNTVLSRSATEPTATRMSCQQPKTLHSNKN